MAGALQPFIGKWKEDKKDNFDEFAKAIGLCPDKTSFYKEAKTVITYKHDGNKWTIDVGISKPEGDINGKHFEFKLGEEYDSANLDGTPMKSTITADGGQFSEKHKMAEVDTEMFITRRIEGNKMIVVTDYKGQVMETLYSRVQD